MPHPCSTCGKIFGRSEHLSRHARRHTTDRPYVCPLCRYSFARKDVLIRHVRLHARDGSATSMRSIAACDVCAHLKIRCDNQTPCGPCREAKVVCSFQRMQQRVGQPRQDGRARDGALDLEGISASGTMLGMTPADSNACYKGPSRKRTNRPMGAQRGAPGAACELGEKAVAQAMNVDLSRDSSPLAPGNLADNPPAEAIE